MGDKLSWYALIAVNFIFYQNLAHKRNGAIFVEDRDYILSYDNNHDETPFLGRIGHRKFKFLNNTAKFSGNEIYGGWIDYINTWRYDHISL